MHFSNIHSEEIIVGKNVVIEPSAIIRGVDGKAKKIVIGDNIYIGSDVQIICNELTILDYSKVHHHTNFHGRMPLQIGYNCWIGQYSIIDSTGGTTIGNNCCVSAHNQLWSHMSFGDTLEGCRFKREAPLTIGNDVWFGGHCIVSPIIAEDKSMALAGSVITKNMKYNEIYAGTPAESVSFKMGAKNNESVKGIVIMGGIFGMEEELQALLNNYVERIVMYTDGTNLRYGLTGEESDRFNLDLYCVYKTKLQ